MNREWTAEEDQLVLSTSHLTTAQVAERLDRTRSAVISRRAMLAKKHGLSFRVNNDPFKPGRRRLLAKTCLSCGLLLEASRFGIDKGKTWRSRCVHCRAFEIGAKHPDRPRGEDSAATANARLQALSLPHAKRHREPWLEADHEVLADPDLTVIEKAIRLERTYMATSSACSKNGYHSRVFQGDPVKGQWVIRLPSRELVSS